MFMEKEKDSYEVSYCKNAVKYYILKNNLVLAFSSSYLKIFLFKDTVNHRMSDWNVSYVNVAPLNYLIENSLLYKVVYSSVIH